MVVHSQLQQLHGDLGLLSSDAFTPAPIFDVFKALLAVVAEEVGEHNAAVVAIKAFVGTVPDDGSPKVVVLRVLTGQLLAAV